MRGNTAKKVDRNSEEFNEHRKCYRRCFGTPDGRKVLANMLIDTGYFDTGGEPALRNYATRLLNTLGFVDVPTKIDQLVDKMFEIAQE